MNTVYDRNNDVMRKYIENMMDISFNKQLQGVIFDVVSMSQDKIEAIVSRNKDIHLYSHSFSDHDLLEPYYPFLKCVQDNLSHLPEAQLDQILDDLYIYKMIKPQIKNYITKKPIKRVPEILRDEVPYEKREIQKAILQLLYHISETNQLVFYLGNLHLSSVSTIELLETIIEDGEDLEILIIGTIDMDIINTEYDSNHFEQFVEVIEKNDWLMNLNSVYVTKQFIEDITLTQEEILKRLEMCLEMHAIEDCINYGEAIYAQWSNEFSIESEKNYLSLLKILGRAFVIKKDKESALFYNNMALGIAVDTDNAYEICDININLGYSYSLGGESRIAKNHVYRALKLARDLEDDELIYRTLLMNFIVEKDSTYGTLQSDSKLVDELTECSAINGYMNTLALIYTNPFELHDHFTDIKNERFQWGLKLAHEIGNNYQLGVAYQNQGTIYSRMGDLEKAFQSFDQSRIIREEIGDVRRTAFVYNSIGHYHFIIENYKESHEAFVQSLNASVKSRNYKEVAMSLYNIALNALLFSKYTLVIDYIEMLLELMKVANISEILYHSKKNIFDIYIIALHKYGQKSKSVNRYNKLKVWGYTNIEGKNEELFFSRLVDFYMSEDMDEKRKLLGEIEVFVPPNDKQVSHFRRYFIVEKVIYLKSIKDLSYLEVIKECRKEFKPAYSQVTLERLKMLETTDQQLREPEVELTDIASDFQRILGLAKNYHNMQKLRNRLNEISFLNIVQKMLMTEEDLSKMLEELQLLILGNTPVERSYCRLHTLEGSKNICLDDMNMVIHEPIANTILGDMEENKKPYLTRISSHIYGYTSMIYIPIFADRHLKAELVLITTSENERLRQEQFGIMTLIGRQVGEAIERIHKSEALKAMNQQLKRLSHTDILTGLNNRNALEAKLQNEKQLISEGKTTQLIILFIDMDNFKYYNDHFGHNIGDEVLVQFAKILKRVVKDMDFVARFGGDEFVVLLKNKSKDEAKQIASDIITRLKESRYFETAISYLLDEKVYISPKNRLTCSIGMSCLSDMATPDVDALLKASDQALYAAKDGGKGRVVER